MTSLRERLVARIRRDGSLTFAQYMEAALFDAEAGFYTRGPGIGRGGHFATSAEAHPAFAEAIIAEASATWQQLGRPAGFRVTEAGPGSGGLALRVSAGLEQRGVEHELVLIERSSGLREQQGALLAGRSVRWVEHPSELDPAPGLLYANELLDALPVRLLQWPHEVLVAADEAGRLVEELRPAAPALRTLLTSSLATPRHGGRYAVCPALEPLVSSCASSVELGRLLLIDYGGTGAQVHDGRRPPVRTYIGGQPGGDPLAAPGTQDLTADVDFGALSAAAALLGLRVVTLKTQAAWLGGHGWAVPPAAQRTESDWALAGLLDDRLPFMVWSAER